jgi:hypothetical protein
MADKKREDLITVREWLDKTFPDGSKRMASGSEENLELLIDPRDVLLVASKSDSDRGRLFSTSGGKVLIESFIYITDSTQNGRYYRVNMLVGIVIEKADGDEYLSVIRMG